MFAKSTVATCLLLPLGAVAWGDAGHQTIGYIAQAFLGPKTLAFVQNTLYSGYNGQLGPAATWADNVKYEAGWAWSSELHYIDAQDDPLHGECNVVDARDCGDHCILTAITNYTARVQDYTLGVIQQDQALRFLTHFIGDIGQPLHCEAYEVGGNDVSEHFAGKKTNLHSIWDTAIPNKTIVANYSNSITTYASSLVARIQTGDYSRLSPQWINCTNPSLQQRSLEDNFDPKMPTLSHRSVTADLECPLEWAQDSNTYVCSTVFSGYQASDLSGAYYAANAPVVDEQIAKSGYRLAAWLNTIFDGEADPDYVTYG